MKRISIYQVLPRLFGNLCSAPQPYGDYERNGSGKLNDFTPLRLEAIKDLGCTHIWYTGVIEHATKTAFGSSIPAHHPAIVKGEAGSPYAISDYYDIAPALASQPEERMAEFEALVERTHSAGLKVLIDFVPNHLSRTYRSDAKPEGIRDFGAEDDPTLAFSPQNNFYYLPQETLTLPSAQGGEAVPYTEYPARATGNNVFSATPSRNDWYETVKLNYGIDLQGDWQSYFDPIPDTWQKMLDILCYWAAKGIDGFRCDMAELVPSPFWRWVIGEVRKRFPELLFIAEVYQPNRYEEYIEAGFDYLYDKVGLYDKLIQILKGSASTSEISGVLGEQERVKQHLLRFMENHDEQRLASDFVVGDGATAFPAMCATALIDGNPVMTYFGQELGERGMDQEGFSGLDGRTTIFDYWAIESVREWLEGKSFALRTQYQWLLHTAQLPIFAQGTLYDLTYTDRSLSERGLLVFLRALHHEVALVAINFGKESVALAITIPQHALGTLGISSGKVYRSTELNSNRTTFVTLSPDMHYALTAYPLTATIHHFTTL